MNLLDIILGIILIFSFFQGTKKGLFVTLASLIGLVLGIMGAIYFSDYAAVSGHDLSLLMRTPKLDLMHPN